MKSIFIAVAAAAIISCWGAYAAPFPTNVIAQQETYQTFSFTIARGGKSPAIKLPVANRPIKMMVACTTNQSEGLGSVTIMRIVSSTGDFVQWDGTDFASHANIEQGLDNTVGAHIMYADISGNVDVQINSPDTLRVVNNYPTQSVTVIVTLTY